MSQKYSALIVVLHWTMALSFFFMLVSGFSMVYAPIEQGLKFDLYQWHKSAGVLLLIAFFVRVMTRFFTSIPKMPDVFKDWEKLAAKAGHTGLYALMIFMPLTGWLMVSSSIYSDLPTIVFGWFEWPHVPGVQYNEFWNNLSTWAHWGGGLLFSAFIFVHIAAVVKHWIKDRVNLLTRIWF